MSDGIVYLVGAGPGNPGLITVRGLECIRCADAVVYDRLVSPALVAKARPGADLIYVGKEPGRHAMEQEEICRLLADLAEQGRSVCRLKGGDPFVFGRGGEEAEVLQDRGIAYEVVPGITSGVAAPAYAGIPVTHRGLAGSVALITGHEAPGKAGGGPGAVDWSRQAHGADTLLIYMGLGGIGETAAALVRAGRTPATPVAVVRLGTRAEQQTVTGTLADIAAQVEAAGITAPAMIVVGEVAALHNRLAWAERRPLHGHRVLAPVVSGAEGAAARAAEPLRRLGAEVWEWPVPRLELGPLLRPVLLEKGIRSLAIASPEAWAALVAQVGDPSLLEGLPVIGAPSARPGVVA